MFYFHPWEIDPDQPRVADAPRRSKLRHYSRLGAMAPKLSKLLSGHDWGRIDAVAANNDEMAIGAILALQQAPADPKSVGVAGVDATPDGLAEMAKGRLAVTVCQDARSQGRVAVDTALRMVRGEGVPGHVDVPFELVTPDTMKGFVGR